MYPFYAEGIINKLDKILSLLEHKQEYAPEVYEGWDKYMTKKGPKIPNWWRTEPTGMGTNADTAYRAFATTITGNK